MPFYWRAFRQIGLSPRLYFRALSASIVGTIVMASAVLAVNYGLPPTIPLIIKLVLLTMTGVISYLGYIVLFRRDRIRALQQTVSVLRSN
jgi:hypothetical protein